MMKTNSMIMAAVVMWLMSVNADAQIVTSVKRGGAKEQVSVPVPGGRPAGADRQYVVEHSRVYFNGVPVEYADANTFRELGYGYAKDRDNVYMNGHVLPEVDPRTFTLKHGRDIDYCDALEAQEEMRHARDVYYKTNFDVFYNGRKLNDASAHSFEVLEGGYAKDAFRVWYHGKEVKDASALSFEVLEGGYTKDAFRVWYHGKEVKDASAHSFEYDGRGYAHDSFNAFYRGELLQ